MNDDYDVGAVVQRIPKKIHIIWPHVSWCDTFSSCVQRTKDLHKDWEIKIWRLGELPSLFCEEIIDHALKNDTIAIASALIGIQIIVRYGGVVIDPDIYFFRSLDPLTYSTRRCLIMRHFRYYGTHFMGCEPHDPYFTRAIRAIPDFYGQLNHNPIPNDIFTAAKLFHYIEDCSSHMKTNLRPTVFHNLCISEPSLFRKFMNKYIENKHPLPSYVRGIRITPDYCKYHNKYYGKGTRTYLEGAEDNFNILISECKNAGII